MTGIAGVRTRSSPLSVEEVLRLQGLGARVRNAGSRIERDLAIDATMVVARRHRDTPVAWTTLARSIGIGDSTLRRWRRRNAPPVAPLPPVDPPTILQDSGPSHAEAGVETEPSLGASGELAANLSTPESTVSNSVDSTVRTLIDIADVPARRRVLVLTGDPRPGRNVFDVEVARIRLELGTSIGHPHIAMVELGEIAKNIDRERPAVIHVAAHRGSGGIALSLRDRTLFVDPHALLDAIERARHRPRCVVLNFCRSDEVADRLSRTAVSAVTWSGQFYDEQAVCFTGEFYRQMAQGAQLPRCFEEAKHLTATLWTDVTGPNLHGSWRDPLL